MTDFSFVQISDHPLREHESDLTFGFPSAYAFRATLRHIAQHAAGRADFVVTTGDLVNGDSLFRSALYEAAMRRALEAHTAHARAVLPSVDSAVGAAWVALDALKGNSTVWIR